ncbi:MAG: thiol-activated cytolysin family protein [Flavobacteriaceae bacterium]
MKTKRMKLKLVHYLLIFCLLPLAFQSCSKDTAEPEPDPISNPDPKEDPEGPDENSNLDDINTLISNLSYNPEDLLNVQNTGGAPSQKTKTNENNSTTGPKQGVMETCKTRDYDLASNFDDVAILRPTSGVIYPGALVVGNAGMLDGAPDPLALGRAPMTLRIDLPGMGENGNIVVEEPSNSKVQSGIDGALEWWNANAYQDGYVNAANSSYQATTSYSSKQMSLDVGLNVEWANGSIASQFEYESSTTKRVAAMVYKQVFYTVTMDTPSSPAAVFDTDVTESQAAAAISSENPPAYVNSVAYGRIIMFRMETTNIDTSIDLDATLEYATGAADGSGSVNSTFDEVLKNSSITIVTIGGNAEVATEAVDVDNIDNWKGALNGVIKGSNAVYSRDNPGVPIAYTIRYLKDNSLAKMGYTTDYSIVECGSFNFDHENVTVENNSNYDIRYRFIYKKPGTNNSTSTGFTEVSQNKRSIKSPPNGAHDVEIQFDFQDLFIWTRMGEFDLGYLNSEKCYEAESSFFKVTVEGVNCN